VIYVDTSVVLAQLLAEDRLPPPEIWEDDLVASRLLEYEVWTRIHALKLFHSHGDAVRDVIERISLIELAPPILARALDPFPLPVRTLDALHLASIEFLRAQRQKFTLASYDTRLVKVARRLGIPIHETIA
jgi:predicted nucleic acid-binding protein